MATNNIQIPLFPSGQGQYHPQPMSKYGGISVYGFRTPASGTDATGARQFVEIPGIRQVLFWRALQVSGENNQEPGNNQVFFVGEDAGLPTGNNRNYTNTGSITVTGTGVANASGTTAFTSVAVSTYVIGSAFYPHWLYVNPGTSSEQKCPIASVTNDSNLVLKDAQITNGTYASWAIRYRFKPFTMVFALDTSYDVLVVYRRL